MKKEKIKNIVLIIVVAVISSTITSFATSSYLFDSIDVKYDNSNGVQAETVQGAIDELYSCASDYSDMNTRLSNVENHFVASDNGFELGNDIAVTDRDHDRGYYIKDSSGNIRSGFLYNNNYAQTNIISYDSTGTWGNFGTLNLYGNPVKINGVDYTNVTRVTTTLNTSNVNTGGSSGVYYTRVGKIVTVEIYDIGPKNYTGGVVQIASDLPKGASGNAVTSIICSLGNNSVCHRVALDGTNLKWWWTTTGVTNLASGSFTYIAE